MIIRIGTVSDVRNLSETIKKSYTTVAQQFNLTVENCPKHPSNCSDEWIKKDMDRGVKYFVLESKSQIIGCIALEKANSETCYLERLAVIPERRNEGLGSRLIKHFFQEAESMGFAAIGIGIIAKQNDLKKWYQKRGFIETGTKAFDHLPFEVLFMEYNIKNC